ncbi:unnamed protein product [Hyaloperonospora brassicae]|uniref:C2 domain-containing protein n=1 Tax=Hyaloperonospora brassicae TaxID=162125 RepID=A0AAV0T603_HYABA|nr:unnamed protein product [Hyaloperonospora brassicae]
MKHDRFSVKVVLFKCHDLVATTNEVGAKCNAYVALTLDGVTQKSSCVKSSLDPHWSPSESFDFEVDKWEAEFLIAQVFDYSHHDEEGLIGSAVIPLALYAGNRNCAMCSYPLVLPDEVGGIGAPKSDIFMQISLLDADGSPVEDFYW